MREIKFRAWDKHSKTMYFSYEVGTTGSIDLLDMQSHFDDERDWELMQNTGLHDKNGKEIYEGDIVEFNDKWEYYRGEYGIKMMFADIEEKKRLIEKYNAEPMHRYEVEFEPTEGYNLSKYDLEQGRYTVIGNIYQNPELLDKEN